MRGDMLVVICTQPGHGLNATVIDAYWGKSNRERRLKMSLSSKGFFIVLLLAFVLGLAGCQQDGPAEKAGKKIDKAAEKAGDKIDNAAEKAGKAIQDQGKR
jgi:hyperosmotically inducible protein